MIASHVVHVAMCSIQLRRLSTMARSSGGAVRAAAMPKGHSLLSARENLLGRESGAAAANRTPSRAAGGPAAGFEQVRYATAMGFSLLAGGAAGG